MDTALRTTRWIDSRISYRIIIVKYSECNPDKNMSLADLLNELNETAHDEEHYSGRGIDYYAEQGFAFMVTRNALRVHRMPVADEEIIISTWTTGVVNDKVFNRQFEVHSLDGELLATCHLTTMLVDLSRMKSIGFSEVDTNTFPYAPPIDKTTEAPECVKIVPEGAPQKLGERIICRSDIDFNYHVNNRMYSKLAADFIPADYFMNPVREYIVNYNRQTSLGDLVEVYGEEREQSYAVFIMVNGVQHFACEFRY